ncbi:MAG: phosphate acyltransferase PlsX [Elusimicrobia bacterium]|nr:phosphate acyltransferase PlsX [Candidatus Obscuribacterium magneticum]
MKIALDAMGGDHGIPINVEGAIQACQAWRDIEIVLVGNERHLARELKRHNAAPRLPLHLHDASDAIGMHEPPVEACRSKPDASIMVCAKLLAQGAVDGLVSAGNSGAIMTASLFHLRRLEGISRPAIATIFPTLKGHCVILDMGANVDCKPKHLLQFAIMGAVYYEAIFKTKRPTVGLLSIGEEESKGNELTLGTHQLLKESGLHYIGNVEGRDIPLGKADVIVCDGFVGNVVLKFGEGLAYALLTLIKKELKTHPLAIIGGLLMRRAFRNIREKVDPHEHGGAPLLGVKGISIVCHGGSNATAIKNALRVAADLYKDNLNEHIQSQIQKHSLTATIA